MKMKKCLMLATIAAFLVSCGGGGRPTFGDNEYPVETVNPKSAAMQTTYPATIKGVQDVEIRPKVSGFITQVCVKEGQTVGAGQLLFVIDNATYQAAVRQAQASVNTATAQLNTAKLTYENNKQLFEKQIIGQYELSTAENSYHTAEASLAQAKASLASAQETLSFCYVKSPAAGVVGSLPFKVGALVSASSTQPLTTVSNISSMEVYFSMTEKELQLADGNIYNHPGTVTKMSGVIDAATGSVQMIAVFQNPEKLLKSGGSGAIIVPHEAHNSVVIPQRCVSEVQNKKFVYILGKDNKVKYTEIKVDPQNDGNNYVVTDGLKTGDRYVTNGITKLSDQMEIIPISEKQYQQKISDQAKAMSSGDVLEAMNAKDSIGMLVMAVVIGIAVIVVIFLLGMWVGAIRANRKK